MSLLVVIVVAAVVIAYVRLARRSRLQWVRKIDLPGHWVWQQGDGSLKLAGQHQHGTFILEESGRTSRGDWRLRGHTLCLVTDAGEELHWEMQFFQQGQIGLEPSPGQRRLYIKDANNVVSLHSRRARDG